MIDKELEQMRREDALGQLLAEYSEKINQLRAENALLREALTEIACFEDRGANGRLARTGRYDAFDEPASVQIARDALSR